MKTKISIWLCTLAVMSFIAINASAANYDEAKVPQYTLPDPLLAADGTIIKTASQWKAVRRHEILSLFEQEVYGRRAAKPEKIRFEHHPIQRDALNGKAIRKQVTIRFDSEGKTHAMHVLIYLPTSSKTKVPVFLAYNFGGNHTINADPGITLSTAWMRMKKGLDYNRKHRATEKARGVAAARWPIETILDRGYGVRGITA